MDIATNDITNQSRVTSVEQCACPLEYQGLSCEVGKPFFRGGGEGENNHWSKLDLYWTGLDLGISYMLCYN